MKKIILNIFICLITLSFTSCVASWGVTTDSVCEDTDINIVISAGTPYYYNGTVEYYIYNNLYWYPFYVDRAWRWYPYRTPFRHGYIPRIPPRPYSNPFIGPNPYHRYHNGRIIYNHRPYYRTGDIIRDNYRLYRPCRNPIYRQRNYPTGFGQRRGSSTRVNPSPNNNPLHIFNGNNRPSGRFGGHR